MNEILAPDHSLTPIVAVVGPTAVGKTSLGVALAEAFDGDIVSADSRQFYRYMDIGTAKPTAAERAQAPHHLIDIADPDETIGLAQFLRLARVAVAGIASSRRLPLVIGGTGQYVRALLEGWQVPDIPPDPVLREKLEQQAAKDPGGLWKRLIHLDPAAAEFVHPNNLRRVIRALEVTIKSGKPFSELRQRKPPPYRTLKLGLTMARQALYARADARVDAMIAAGLAQEVASLVAQGYGWDLPAMSSLGYSQFRPHLGGDAPLDEVIERIKLDTHDFIRRQYAWFSPHAPDIIWLDAQDPAMQAHAVELTATFLQTTSD